VFIALKFSILNGNTQPDPVINENFAGSRPVAMAGEPLFWAPGIPGPPGPVFFKETPSVMEKLIICLFLCFAPALVVLPQSRPLKVGDTIPSFSLRDQDGKVFDSREHLGKNILVIYFYPKDESAVCTREACAFRDDYAAFSRAGALVIAINAADRLSHKSFQQHHQLPFILLSDPRNEVLKKFGVKSKFFISGRETFVVDLSGKIVYSYDSFTNGQAHAEKTLQFIEQLNKK
jgi:peroxiredoxin Q/BCP